MKHTDANDPPAPADDPATLPVKHTDTNNPPAPVEDSATKPAQVATGNSHNKWPLPPISTEAPTTTNALSVLLSAMSSKAKASAAAEQVDDPKDPGNGQQHAGAQLLASSDDPTDPDNPGQQQGSNEGGSQQSGHDSPQDPTLPEDSAKPENGQQHAETQSSGSSSPEDPGHSEQQEGSGGSGGSNSQQAGHGSPQDPAIPDGNANSAGSSNPSSHDAAVAGQAAAVWTHGGQTFTAVPSGGSVIVQDDGAKSTLSAGATATFAGQAISVPPSAGAIVVDGAAMSFKPVAGTGNGHSAQPEAVVTGSGQTFTVAVQGESLVLKAVGTTTTMAYGAAGTFAGQSVSMPPSLGSTAVEVNGKAFTLQSGGDAGDTGAIAITTVITQDGKTFTAVMQGESNVVLKAASTTLTVPRGSALTLGDDVFSAPTAGSVLLLDGSTITFAPKGPSETIGLMTHDGQTLSAVDLESSVVVMEGGSTVTLANGAQTIIGEDTISAASTGGGLVINGTSTVVLSTRTNAVASSASSNGEVETATGASEDAESAARADQSSIHVWLSIVLAMVVCLAVGW